MSKALSEEDRVLWSLVTKTAKPLRKPLSPSFASGPSKPAPVAQAPAAPPSPPMALPSSLQPRKEQVAQKFDVQTRDKISKGRLPLEGRVDLHGMTQEEAYSLLLSFLRRAHEGGVRYVLVITGKGSSSRGDGVLRKSLPSWLKTQQFRHLVSGIDEASRYHGGGGAFYVRLRRRGAGR
ncbi:MAG: DNA mismatch repair protein MutS [Rhizobiaceae bacterium]|nr:MAG: DNA mismatch repair protein MutS [Rhizobiaceae bacterium]CAG1012777.1 putative DNA endonuclease SmrA [Rhizobiaceae bacterium]